MDKQKQYSARPQGFRGSRRPEPAKAQEEQPKKKPAAKKAAPKPPKKRAKRRVQRRKRLSAKQLLVIIAAVLAAALIAFFVIRGVIVSKNKTVHMLPEIYDIETPEEEAADAYTAAGTEAVEGAPVDNFIAEGSGA